MTHRYFVDWAAPIIRNSGNMRVLASDKKVAISKAKAKLGKRVKEQHLHHFDAVRIVKK